MHGIYNQSHQTLLHFGTVDHFTQKRGQRPKFVNLISTNNEITTHYGQHSGTRSCQIVHCCLRLGCTDLDTDRCRMFSSDIAAWSCPNVEGVLRYVLHVRAIEGVETKHCFYTTGFKPRKLFHGRKDNKTNDSN